jgi:tRNA threonylcarbamoyladenosine biosynthesis protein TsaE
MEKLINTKTVCKTAEDTKMFGRTLASLLPQNLSIALLGDLGSGKTTFVKGLALGFGITTTINSPSFNILNVYRGQPTLLHVDAYRLDGSEEAVSNLLLDDFMIPPYYLVVEWPELLHNFLMTCDVKIYFTRNVNSSVNISIHA